MSILDGNAHGLIVPATSTTQNFTKKIKKNLFCINVNKNVKEKLSLGFGVTKIKIDTAGACFQKSGHNQHPPSPIQDRVKIDYRSF